MFRSMVAGGLLAASLLATPANAAVNLIQNGGFEEFPIPLFNAVEHLPGSSTLPGWSINVGIVQQGRSPDAFEADQYVGFLSTGQGVELQQSVVTIVGQEYEFAFAYRRPIGRIGTSTLIFGLTGSRFANLLFDQSPVTDLTWVVFNHSFIADSSLTTFKFSGSNGVSVDAVSLTAVSAAIPEPATWAMMLIGFAGLGVAARRRERAAGRRLPAA